jgi:hypothetical protein
VELRVSQRKKNALYHARENAVRLQPMSKPRLIQSGLNPLAIDVNHVKENAVLIPWERNQKVWPYYVQDVNLDVNLLVANQICPTQIRTQEDAVTQIKIQKRVL